jgi:hypothetical protein
MSQEAAVVHPVVKSTYKNLSEVLTAYWSGDRAGKELVNVVHSSPRLAQWAKVAEGFRIWATDESMSITVTTDKIYTTKGVRTGDLQNGLPAQTLFNTIQTAQAIVQANGDVGEDEDYFATGVEFNDGAALDAALEETHAAPLAEDDAELIEDVTAEQALDAQQKREDGPSPVLTVSKKFIEDLAATPAVTHTEKINSKNASTDGVICTYCGNLNKQTYRGNCPQCPKGVLPEKSKESKESLAKDALLGRSVLSNLKSLQGRILTIIDASFSDKEQRSAVKTMINKEFRREITKVGGDE